MLNNKFNSANEKVTIEEIHLVEENLEVKFPVELEQLYLLYNGGSPEKYTFYDEDGDEYIVQKFLYIKCDRNFKETVEYFTKDFRSDGIFPNWLIPVAYDPGGNYYCVSVDDQDYGNIYYWNHEYEIGEDIENHIVYLARTITEFIENMK